MQSIIDNTDKEKNIKMVLVGNKIDLTHREVTTEEGRKLAEFYHIPFFETSAKDNIGINECVRSLIKEVIENFKPSNNIELGKTDQNKSGGCISC